METSRKLFIPVVLGTARMGRLSLHPARLVTEELSKRNGVETDLIDIAKLPLPTNDAGEAIKNAEFATKMYRADALVIVSPEYNHGYSGLLKHVLDSCLKEYIHKAVGIVGVSAGPFGGVRVVQNLLPVMASSDSLILGCKFLQRAKGALCRRRAFGGILHMAHRQVLKGIDLDGQDATPPS